MSKPTPPPYDPKPHLRRGIEHICFEWVHFCSASHYIIFGKAPWRTLADKAFLSIYRQLGDFLVNDTRAKRYGDELPDILAIDYLPGGSADRKWSLPLWDTKWRDAMNKQQAHLTYERDKHWDHTDPVIGAKPLMREMREAWKLFVDKIDPVHKPDFIAEIEGHRAQGYYSEVMF